MKTYTKQDFHNPEQLTRQQVGEEYRLLFPNETDRRHENVAQFLERGRWIFADGGANMNSYRVPLATPLPDGTVLSSNDCCWSDEKPSEPHKAVYLAGPMSNIPDYNFPAFYSAAESLECQGYEVINPAQLDVDAGYPLERLKALTPDEFKVFLKGAMKRDLDALQQCDAIALLPGWENSNGANAELAVAEWMGLEILYYREGGGAVAGDAIYPPDNREEEVWEGSRYDTTQSHFASDDPKGAAGALKAPMWLLPPYALQQTAWVHKHGAAKYLPYNWRGTGVCATTYISAIMRHLDAWRDGEDNDPDSGISHIAHIAASCNILLDAQHCGKLNDDRPKLSK